MDEKPKKKFKNNKARNLVIDLATLFVIAVIAVFIIVLTGQKDGSITGSGGSIEITGLHCSKSSPESTFLNQKYVASSGQHDVSANFKDGQLTDIMYTFTAIFPPRVDLTEVRTNLHVNFDLAYGNVYVHRDSVWSESFSISEENHSAKMSVYAEGSSLRSSNAEAFALPTSENFPKTLSALQVAYSNEGFSCQVSE